MKETAPFGANDLAEIDELLLSRASEVIAMEDVHDGNRDPRAIGLRHDVDASQRVTAHALDTAVRIAEWEAARGYRATFYVLHTASYWEAPGFREGVRVDPYLVSVVCDLLERLAEALRTGRDPDAILDEAIATLRGYGHRVRGVAGHGDAFCNRDAAPGEISFANDEQFLQCARPQEGAPDRIITRGRIAHKLAPRPLSDFGLEYEALKCAYGQGMLPFRISDSGGKWLNPGWEETVEKWNRERAEHPGLAVATRDIRQLHFLWHPDWWQQAFVPLRAAA